MLLRALVEPKGHDGDLDINCGGGKLRCQWRLWIENEREGARLRKKSRSSPRTRRRGQQARGGFNGDEFDGDLLCGRRGLGDDSGVLGENWSTSFCRATKTK